ncbi:MAG: glucuronate isomerase [Firmicutes bacterium]|nr:glucuronate isomerase [Bacillota bacterium]
MFPNDNFLLQTPAARQIYESVKNLPLIDYHCHLDPREIAENKRFRDMTEMWLGGDHYKWRLMRANGVPEEYITGGAEPYEKFARWCETLGDCVGSPLYHWTHLELRRYFGWDKLLSKETAEEAWDFCNGVLAQADFSVWGILRKFHVETLCTTDDPSDDLRWHAQIRASGLPCSVLPAFRPPNDLGADAPGFAAYAGKLASLTGVKIAGFSDLRKALAARIGFFHENGCRLADCSLEGYAYAESTPAELDEIVGGALLGRPADRLGARKFMTALLLALSAEYSGRGWVSQLRFGSLRNVNSRMTRLQGPAAGYDSISDEPFALHLANLLNAMEERESLPKTIMYTLDPSANGAVASMTGNFQGGGVKGKMQFGSAWWFNDTKAGMRAHMTALADMGLLARFVGMTTDSRSFLSYTRHEYFRRVLAGLMGEWVENGEFPADMAKLAKIAGDISYFNAREYFGF